MENNKQIQKAGDGSQQVQAQTIIVNNGITEERARAIFTEMNELALQEYTNDAYKIATDRINCFENRLMPRILSIENSLPMFADPAFQFQLKSAQKTAAATERQDDYALLTELLVCHIQKGNDRKNRAGISKAVEIVDEVDNDALCALTAAHALGTLIPRSESIKGGLETLDGTFSKIIYEELPSGDQWLDHLDILGAIRTVHFVKLKPLEQYSVERFEGYSCIGIERNSDNFKKAEEYLAKVALNDSILVDNECFEGYVRLPIIKRKYINDFLVSNGDNYRHINDAEKKALESIWELYENDAQKLTEVHNNFMKLWDSFESLKKLHVWWNDIPYSFSITQVGTILAHTNAKRCDKSIPDLI